MFWKPHWFTQRLHDKCTSWITIYPLNDIRVICLHNSMSFGNTRSIFWEGRPLNEAGIPTEIWRIRGNIKHIEFQLKSGFVAQDFSIRMTSPASWKISHFNWNVISFMVPVMSFCCTTCLLQYSVNLSFSFSQHTEHLPTLRTEGCIIILLQFFVHDRQNMSIYMYIIQTVNMMTWLLWRRADPICFQITALSLYHHNRYFVHSLHFILTDASYVSTRATKKRYGWSLCEVIITISVKQNVVWYS